jgi:hypothetical protein
MEKYDKEAKAVVEWFSHEPQEPVIIKDFDPAYSSLLRAMLTRSAETQKRAALLK